MGKKRKIVEQEAQVNNKKLPKRNFDNPNSFYRMNPKWSFRYTDFQHEKWGVCLNAEVLSDMLEKMNGLERMTWSDILLSTSGRSGNTRNHPIPLSDIIVDAQKRFNDLNLTDIFEDEIYSLALNNKFRLFGFIDDEGTFLLIWIDRNHEICPSKKRHT